MYKSCKHPEHASAVHDSRPTQASGIHTHGHFQRRRWRPVTNCRSSDQLQNSKTPALRPAHSLITKHQVLYLVQCRSWRPGNPSSLHPARIAITSCRDPIDQTQHLLQQAHTLPYPYWLSAVHLRPGPTKSTAKPTTCVKGQPCASTGMLAQGPWPIAWIALQDKQIICQDICKAH
jgi:hypothetical protein